MCVYGLKRADAEGQQPRTRQIETFAIVSRFSRSTSELQLHGLDRATALALALASQAVSAGWGTNGGVIGICSWYRLWCGTPEIESLNEISSL